jgi:hypothetical protein
VSGLILALTIGFLLGILLMIFLITGREEQDLLDRVERAEASRVRVTQGIESEGELAKGGPRERAPREDA